MKIKMKSKNIKINYEQNYNFDHRRQKWNKLQNFDHRRHKDCKLQTSTIGGLRKVFAQPNQNQAISNYDVDKKQNPNKNQKKNLESIISHGKSKKKSNPSVIEKVVNRQIQNTIKESYKIRISKKLIKYKKLIK